MESLKRMTFISSYERLFFGWSLSKDHWEDSLLLRGYSVG